MKRSAYKLTILIGLILVLVISVCTNKNELENVENLKSTIHELTDQIHILVATQERLEEELQIVKESNQIESSNDYSTLYALQHLIRSLPNVEFKRGFIKEVHEEANQLILDVDFKNMILDTNQPNGFYLEDMEDDTVILSEDVEIYILVTPDRMESIQKRDLLDTVHLTARYMDFYFIDGHLVIISEQYLP